MASSKSSTPRAPKLQRWVDLIAALLGRHSALTFTDLARDVPAYALGRNATEKDKETVKRMFERDKLELRELGLPIETIGDEGDEETAYRLRTKDFYLPYLSVVTERGLRRPNRVDKFGYKALAELTFDADELAAVAEAAARVRQLGDPALEDDAESAMRKLAFDLPVDASMPPDPDVVLGASRTPASAETLRALSAALVARKRVAMSYYSMSTDTDSAREVEPYGLFFLNANWYLAARDTTGAEVKSYRVNRIRSCKVNSARALTPDYEIPPTFRLKEHAFSKQAWELGGESGTEATVEVRGSSGATVAAAALGTPVSGHANQRRFPVRRPDVFARWLMSFAGEMVAVAPPALVEECRRQVAATRALYAAGRRQKAGR